MEQKPAQKKGNLSKGIIFGLIFWISLFIVISGVNLLYN